MNSSSIYAIIRLQAGFERRIAVFKKNYFNIIKNNLFIKLILFFSAIVVSSFIFTGWFISDRVSSLLIEKESLYSNQIIERMENYINSKEKSFKQIFFNIYYSNKTSYNNLMEYLNSNDTSNFVLRRTVEDYLSIIHSSDNDLLDVIYT